MTLPASTAASKGSGHPRAAASRVARSACTQVAPGGRILDAGCGTGRVGAELFRRGHAVVGALGREPAESLDVPAGMPRPVSAHPPRLPARGLLRLLRLLRQWLPDRAPPGR